MYSDELVIALSEFSVTEHLIGFIHLLKLFLSILMINLLLLRVEHVRVMLLSLLEELLLDLLLCGINWHPQDLIVVFINRELKVHGGE